MAGLEEYVKYVSEATDVVEFKLIRHRDDIDNEAIGFKPEMAHQVFGETEKIFGYQNLKIRLYYTAGPLYTYFSYKYSKKISDSKNTDGLQATDIETAISEILPDGCYYTSLDEFAIQIEKNDKFMPCGDHLITFTKTKENVTQTFQIYRCDINTANFKAFFLRLQSFILWFADAANYIDIDDPQWIYYVTYEKYTDSTGNTRYATVGYCTVYQYYTFPEHNRLNISQILVLPPFQQLGIGTKMIETIYNQFMKDSTVLDISVEDPSEEFVRIRNYIDVKLCCALPSFAPDKLRCGFSQDMIKEAREKFKINKRQCRIVYEILKLKNLNEHDEREYKPYRLEVKKRLNQVYYKQKRVLELARKRGVNVEAALELLPPVDERVEQLKVEFENVLENYKRVIEKLDEK